MSKDFQTVSASSAQVDDLVTELKSRLMLISDQTVTHLQAHGVIKAGEIEAMRMRADGCCKPDGGTCCVNKKSLM